MVVKPLVGKCYNITIDGKTVLKGWFIIVTPDGTIYLVERGSSWTYNIFRKFYKSDYDFSKNIISKSSRKQGVSVLFAMLLGIGLLRAFPSELTLSIFFGNIVHGPNLFYGVINITLLFTTILFMTRIMRCWRRWRLDRFLSQHAASLYSVGTIRLTKAIKKISGGAELW